jgi:hypothetical protein
MLKMRTLILMAILLSGCGIGPNTNNDDRIREYKKCKDAGMDAVENMAGDVFCIPPRLK